MFFSVRDEHKAKSVIDSIGNENIDYIIMDVADERNVLNGIESLKEKTDSLIF